MSKSEHNEVFINTLIAQCESVVGQLHAAEKVIERFEAAARRLVMKGAKYPKGSASRELADLLAESDATYRIDDEPQGDVHAEN